MQINRTGVVSFHDASLHVIEEGISDARKAGGHAAATDWEKKFKHEVFARIVQQLNRIGWKCVVPEQMIKEYSLAFAQSHRYCVKGDLQADLSVSGRCIELKMFQSVNCPTRPDCNGRYESNKEQVMPYLLRLEMERTRRRIKNYLCSVFDNYTFKADRADGRSNKCGFMHRTALDWIAGCYETSWHFKGDLSRYEISSGNRKSADKQNLEHGQRVFFYDHKGRINTGVAYYNINNMWWVATGKYSVTNKACFELFTALPENARVKRNEKLRNKRLQSEMAEAIQQMAFERAAILRDILFPKKEEEIFVVRHECGAYHRPGFEGYTNDLSEAGKFTETQVRGYRKGTNTVIPINTLAKEHECIHA